MMDALESTLPEAGDNASLPASLGRTSGKCCVCATDGDGNQSSLRDQSTSQCSIFPTTCQDQAAARWLLRLTSRHGDDLWLRESLLFTILGVS